MKRTVPIALKYLGPPLAALTCVLAGRLVWEQTVWTWDRGPQMVGFSLMHSGLGPLLLLAALGGAIWLCIVLIAAFWSRSSGGKVVVVSAVVYAMAVGVMALPYGFWQRAFIDKFTPEQSIDLFTYAAALGDLETVKAFLVRGVNVNADAGDGTALHGAAVQGNLDVIKLLVAKGADVNAINAYGDSPLANAVNAWRRAGEAKTLLESYGAKLVRGTAEQRDQAMKERLQKDSDRREKRR